VSAPYLVLGSGAAGTSAAVELRAAGFDGRIVLVGEEAQPPYDRTQLSKDRLQGRDPVELHPAERFRDDEIELLLGRRATSIDTHRKAVTLSGGEALDYDRLLLATGGRARRIDLPGAELDGVHYLRTAEDASAILAAAERGTRAAVVGMGFVGSEVAASLRSRGLAVTGIDHIPLPLAPVLGEEIARCLLELHAERGVELRLGAGVVAFTGTSRVDAVLTTDGREVPADLVVVGAGMEPNVELAVEAGIDVAHGIVVDEHCRTSAPDVFAAGDVAVHPSARYGRLVRVEHWDHAIRHGRAAARAMAGTAAGAEEDYWFWSDVYDTNVQCSGLLGPHDELVVRGSVAERRFIAFGIVDGRVEFAVALNSGRDLRRAAPLVKSGARVDAAQLRDTSQDLRRLA
jgi:3-phenylpropionate/trans-cinnamate dioxygenase ferredoxin reductase subunit